VTREADFDLFGNQRGRKLTQFRSRPGESRTRTDPVVAVSDIQYGGFDGTPITAG
jgi:hypothetical protein